MASEQYAALPTRRRSRGYVSTRRRAAWTSQWSRLLLVVVVILGLLGRGAQGYGTTTGRMALGEHSTCVVLANLTEVCFGTNFQDVDPGAGVGYRDLDPFSPAGPIINTVTGGLKFRCTLYADRTVKCRGSDLNEVSQELQGRMSEHNHDIIQIAAGMSSACMLNSTGSVHCWGGKNSWVYFGQWRNHEHVEYPAITALPANTGFVSVSVGMWHTCALRPDGRAVLWGYSNHQATAVAMNWASEELASIKSLSCGSEITCIVYFDGHAVCKVRSGRWGGRERERERERERQRDRQRDRGRETKTDPS